MRRHEAAGTMKDPEYQTAAQVFYQRFVCRLDPWPAWLTQEAEEMNIDLNTHMYTSELPRTGPLSRWDIRARLGDIRLPTLITAGRYDGAAGGQEQLLHDGIPGSELVIFEESSHYAHAEESDRYLAVLDDFLRRVEQRYTEQLL
jgi:proline-specific peptidase